MTYFGNQSEFEKYARSKQGISSGTLHDYYRQLTNLTPNVIEERPMNATALDVFSRLMMDRIIFLGVPINDEVANIITAQLLFLQSSDPSRDVQIYINSPGGSIYAGLGIYDTMQYISPDVATICTGIAASMGAVLLAAGTPGKRAALRHSRVMIHQAAGGIQGQASDIEVMVNETIKMQNELFEIIAEHTGQPADRIRKDSDRDYWMSSEEAKEYGMVDEVLIRKQRDEDED